MVSSRAAGRAGDVEVRRNGAETGRRLRAPAEEWWHKSGLDGPQINANHPDVVVGQDNVDDLLSSLGF